MKRYQVFTLVGFISFVVSLTLTFLLMWTCGQEPVNMLQQTIFGISSAFMYCTTIIMFIIGYRMKEQL